MDRINPIVKDDLDYIISASINWKQLEGKTILISGANGFLPAYLVETILYLNDNVFKTKACVFALVRNKQKAVMRFASYTDRVDLQFIVQDVCQPIIIELHIDYIIHAASLASPKYYKDMPVDVLLPNIIGTYNLLELASSQKVSGFLLFSSGEIYGEIEEQFMPVKENYDGYLDCMQVRSCYAQSKRMAETMCVSWGQQYGVPIKVVRPFHTYGPGMPLADGRVFSDFVANIVKNEDIVLKSDGLSKRAFCYLADATVAFFTVLLHGEVGAAYNVGNKDCEISILELANMLVDLFPDDKLKVVSLQRSDTYLVSKVQRSLPDTQKLESLGWSAKYSLREGFMKTVQSFREKNK